MKIIVIICHDKQKFYTTVVVNEYMNEINQYAHKKFYLANSFDILELLGFKIHLL
jgi:hypothetical protein